MWRDGGEAARLSSPANVRQSRGGIEDKRKKHVSSSPIRGELGRDPRRRSTSTTTTTTRTTTTGTGVQTDDYEGNVRNTFAVQRRGGPLLLLQSPPPSGGERVAGSAWLSELRIFSLRADREWNGRSGETELSSSFFFRSFVARGLSKILRGYDDGICVNDRILSKGKGFREFLVSLLKKSNGLRNI